MKKLIYFLLVFLAIKTNAQTVQNALNTKFSNQVNIGKQGVAYAITHNSAWLEIGQDNTTKALRISRGDTATVVTPTFGLIHYQMSNGKMYWRDATKWNECGVPEGTYVKYADSTITFATPTNLIDSANSLRNLINNHIALDFDIDSTNEIQTLSILGQDVTLSKGGGTITLPSGGSTTNTLTNPTNTITSTVNGVVATAPAVNTVVNSFTSPNLTTTVNGVASTPVDLTTIATANNGLTKTALNTQLGGNLIQATTITNNGFNLNITGIKNNSFNSDGRTVFGSLTPTAGYQTTIDVGAANNGLDIANITTGGANAIRIPVSRYISFGNQCFIDGSSAGFSTYNSAYNSIFFVRHSTIGNANPSRLAGSLTVGFPTSTTAIGYAGANAFTGVSGARLTVSQFDATPTTNSGFRIVNEQLQTDKKYSSFWVDNAGNLNINSGSMDNINNQLVTDANRVIITQSGGVVIPRMTKAQRNAIVGAVAGTIIYQTDAIPGLRCFNGTNWMRYTETIDL